MTVKRESFVRLNTHVRPDQKEFIKKVAKMSNFSEGHLSRVIIDFYIKSFKK